MKKIVGHPVSAKEEARTIFSIVEKKQLEDKLALLDMGQRLTISELSDRFTAGERSDLSCDTLRMDRLALKLLADAIGGKRAVRAVHSNDMITFKTTCMARQLSPETIRTYFRHIKAALNWAQTNGFRSKPVRIPKVKAKKRIPRACTNQEIDDILAWLKTHHPETWAYAQFSLWTGCRLAELINLQWQDVTIYNSPTPAGVHGTVRITGKGDKERITYLLAPAMEAILPIKDIGPVFARLHPSTISHRFKKAVRKTGHEKPNFHSLRHTAAIRMIGQGINIRVVQKILGHANISTTMVYTEVFDAMVEDEFGKLAPVDNPSTKHRNQLKLKGGLDSS